VQTTTGAGSGTSPAPLLLDSVPSGAPYNRLLSPELVAGLVREQEHARALNFALDLGRFYRNTTHDAWTAGSSMGPQNTIDGGQSTLPEPGAYLPPHFIVGET